MVSEAAVAVKQTTLSPWMDSVRELRPDMDNAALSTLSPSERSFHGHDLSVKRAQRLVETLVGVGPGGEMEIRIWYTMRRGVRAGTF